MNRGFSLTELLVVIAVMLLLVALVLPVFTFAVEYAKYVQCQSNLRTFYTGLHGYAVDHRSRMPYYWDENDVYNNLDKTPMLWGYPAILYIEGDFPRTNPYTNSPWNNPSDWNDFGKCLREQCGGGVADIFFCPAGDNTYRYRAYEGQRKYLSNYYGFFGPDGDISHAIGKVRDYQSSDPDGFNRPITLGQDPGGTWLITDYNWSGGNTAHKDDTKNILHLDGSVVHTKKPYWANEYEWLDRFPP